jgi:parallel beta-helix repeat protein
MKKLVVVGIIILLVGMSIPSTGINVEKSTASYDGNTLYVGGSGPGNYSKIQDAIDNASDGDTVFVYNGIFIEKLKINKSITLLGENRDSTIINGKGSPKSWHIISIYTDDVTISNLNVRNTTSNWATICLRGRNCKIINNRISSNKLYGIITYSGNNISNNIIHNNEIGIYNDLTLFNNQIYNNSFHNNTNGIFFEFGTGEFLKSSNEIRWNRFYNNKFGINFGSSINKYNIISDNIFYNNDYGIYANLDLGDQGLFTSFNSNTISNNQIYSNKKSGIYLELGTFSMAKFNKIEENQIYSNKKSGITLYVGVITNTVRLPRFNVIRNNYITSNGEYGILVERWSNTKIENNIIQNHSEFGLYLIDSFYCNIRKNNFFNNKDEASFIFFVILHPGRDYLMRLLIFFRFNRWNNNYWNESKISPYKIEGITGINSIQGDLMARYGFDIDWHPAKEPYDI